MNPQSVTAPDRTKLTSIYKTDYPITLDGVLWWNGRIQHMGYVMFGHHTYNNDDYFGTDALKTEWDYTGNVNKAIEEI